MYWYHAHEHGGSQLQVMGGLSGALLVDGQLDVFTELDDATEQLLSLKDIPVPECAGGHGCQWGFSDSDWLLVNGGI